MKIIYVGDPMCSWCYGIAPEWTKVSEHYKDKADIELVMGGLRPYYNVPMTEMKDFLSEHWKEVHEATDQAFSYGILDRPELVYDTEPPCRAAVVVRSLAKEKEVAFFKEIQKAFYSDNKYLSDPAAYTEILDKLDISKEAFTTAFTSAEYREKVKEDFSRARDLGVQSFPTILLEYQGQTHIVARGYTKSENIIAAIASALH